MGKMFKYKGRRYTEKELQEYVIPVNYSFEQYAQGDDKSLLEICDLFLDFFWVHKNLEENYNKSNIGVVLFNKNDYGKPSRNDVEEMLQYIIVTKAVAYFNPKAKNFFGWAEAILEQHLPKMIVELINPLSFRSLPVNKGLPETQASKVLEFAKAEDAKANENALDIDVINNKLIVNDIIEFLNNEEYGDMFLFLMGFNKKGQFSFTKKKTVKETAERFGITPKTVIYHSKKIKAKIIEVFADELS